MEQLGFFNDDPGRPASPKDLKFRSISNETLNLIAREKHYLHREVNSNWAFGAYHKEFLFGAISFAKPANPTLCDAICGEEARLRVYELNRLWMDDRCPKNSESRFIGWALRELSNVKPHLILVSYADSAFGHMGRVYKATNWVYTGLTKTHFDKVFPDGRHPRSVTPSDRSSAETVVRERSRKHRYVYFYDPIDRANLAWETFVYPDKVLPE